MTRPILVRGAATPEELAAVLAVVASRREPRKPTPPDAYARWRAGRLAAVRDRLPR